MKLIPDNFIIIKFNPILLYLIFIIAITQIQYNCLLNSKYPNRIELFAKLNKSNYLPFELNYSKLFRTKLNFYY